MLVLDYDYHTKRSIQTKAQFDKEWTEYRKKQCPDRYKFELEYLSMNYNKQDTISEIKTERLIIPLIKHKSDINGDILQEMYSLVNNMYLEQER